MVKVDILREMVERVNDKYTENEINKKVTQRDIDFMISAFCEMVKETLHEDANEKIALGTLGSFRAKEVPAKEGVSAINGKAWHTDAHSEVTFKISKTEKML